MVLLGHILRAGFTMSPETEPALPRPGRVCLAPCQGTSCMVVSPIFTSFVDVPKNSVLLDASLAYINVLHIDADVNGNLAVVSGHVLDIWRRYALCWRYGHRPESPHSTAEVSLSAL